MFEREEVEWIWKRKCEEEEKEERRRRRWIDISSQVGAGQIFGKPTIEVNYSYSAR